MLRVFRLLAPAWMPAFFCAGLLLLLQGCSLLPKSEPAETEAGAKPVGGEKPAGAREAFSVSVKAPDTVREYLERNLEIQRYRQIDDLGAAELSRLMVAAEGNARELLGTLGYFTPTLTLELQETPEAKAPREVRITVDPGEPTRIHQVQIDFSGPIATDPTAEVQREAIRKDWPLRTGQVFTQLGWDNAKSAALRSLTAKRFPTGSVELSRAEIDADRGQARLHVDYRSGPAYRFGPLDVRGSERYDADAARRIARVPTGSDYDQQKLLDAQQRLASSGYYDSVFLTLDTDGSNPLWAPVIAQVREAPLQKVVMGVGFTTDSGPRLSLDHIHNRMPLLGWRAVSKLSVDRETQSLGTEWNAVPDDKGWRWFGAGQLKSETSGSYEVDSGRVRGGLGKSSDHIDYTYFLQYDSARNRGVNAPPSASALSVNWGWTGRYFDDAGVPTRGHGLALELGAGYTLTGEHLPFTRVYGRWLGIVPLGWADKDDSASAARSSRLQLRAEAGAVTAKDRAQIPSTLMFLTGGDTTVRGYGYREIGTRRTDGQIVAGRYMTVASVEWQRPFVYQGKLTEWESAVFIDAGAVADRPGDLKTKVGIGVGARWRSPVGPVQADVAYGVDTKKFRLHLRLGFTF
ncbi:BamA/TamA family outer membrane protein [Variovorax guangxiensis]|uniref:autotransporter assembly complex protein TamA n=1 Tax=Variovorax guangxiensis TaxID=1775474 RepID=UPI0028596CC0|nr:BamA/TamA family outer membrane protein [Variovorax guangxiensis]MDR6858102.1 translocation and assembly module TamA [Variovorax guangxiensis]